MNAPGILWHLSTHECEECLVYGNISDDFIKRSILTKLHFRVNLRNYRRKAVELSCSSVTSRRPSRSQHWCCSWWTSSCECVLSWLAELILTLSQVPFSHPTKWCWNSTATTSRRLRARAAFPARGSGIRSAKSNGTEQHTSHHIVLNTFFFFSLNNYCWWIFCFAVRHKVCVRLHCSVDFTFDLLGLSHILIWMKIHLEELKSNWFVTRYFLQTHNTHPDNWGCLTKTCTWK